MSRSHDSAHSIKHSCCSEYHMEEKLVGENAAPFDAKLTGNTVQCSTLHNLDLNQQSMLRL